MRFMVYDTASGVVLRSGQCPEELLAIQAGAGETAIEVPTGIDEPEDYYMSVGEPVAKPLITTVATWSTLAITANGVSAATLGAGLPNPSTVVIRPPADLGIANIANQIVTDGTFNLTTTVPGDYTVKVSATHYLDYEETISAT